MKDRLISIMLCMLLVLGLMSGCGQTETASEPETNSTASVQQASETQPAEAQEETSVAAPAESVPEEEAEEPADLTVTLPLCDTVETISMWWGGFDGGNFGNETPGATLVSQELESRTNVHVEYSSCAGTAADEMRNLMFASGDYCDMIREPAYYSGGLEKGVEDDVYMDITELLEENSPNYWALISADSKTLKSVTTDNGYRIAYYQIYTEPSSQGNGLMLRTDYLSELGLELPVTYEDWTEVLTRVKEEKGVETPFFMNGTGFASGMMSGFGLSEDWFQVDGQVQYAPIQDSFRDYLELMNNWYESGLISQDFTDHKPGYNSQDDVIAGSVIAVYDRASCITDYMNAIEGSEFVGITEPVVNEGDELHFYTGGSMAGTSPGLAISTQCSNVELCMAWMDYLYTADGAILNSFGVEGETYAKEGDEFAFTDLLTNNPEGLPLTLAKLKYLDGLAGGTGLYDQSCELAGVNENTRACDAAWKNDGAYVLPEYELSVDEGESFSKIMADIETYVDEMTLKYIQGQESLDTFGEFVENIKNMNVDEAISLKQDGLDRYNSR